MGVPAAGSSTRRAARRTNSGVANDVPPNFRIRGCARTSTIRFAQEGAHRDGRADEKSPDFRNAADRSAIRIHSDRATAA
ncbi:hypothetical protein ACH347_04395 [Saccharopolyspora sp. 5N102]|uniref:hypothetical protein n=1 Tax=Saccharopolyspora sp. 5N102 TaxID=3375155 RepID=UPI0037A3158E